IFLAIIAIPCFGVFLYWGTSRLARFMPWTLSQGQIALIIITIGGALLLLEILVHPYLDRSAYDKFQKTLPLGATFLSPTPRCIELTRPIASFRDENEIREKLPILKAKRLPNIYFFVIETFRKDFVNSETAPNLLAFAEKNINISSSFANANWTALSWFALFQSSFPYDWTAIRDHWTGGSIPLQLLKKMGYQIHTYSAADLHYFNLDQVIFGKNRELADSIEDYSTDRTLEPCDRDARCISSFAKKLAKKEGKTGNVYLFFFDGTHSEYSFPKDFPLRFTPIVKQIDYLTVNAKEIEPIKNRYRNAIAHIDTLLGNFFHLLKCEGVYDDAVIAITGDHGEEFYEEGALFHGTHLNRYQLEVPIICKFGKLRPTISEATHIDLFPSILHHISKVDSFDSLFDGRSLLSSKKRSPYRIAVLQNGPDTPFEFAIEKKNGHLQLRFLDPKNIYQQTKLEVISLQVDGKIPECSLEETLETTFPNALNLLFRE
ncbi:MAG TPA: sulfatase-like hydrolase/transferase, partial [Chlamydiales bacterium]|nr:sulfatase-like hydrolase/transferase [Chlamydiales bacterium]